MKLHNAAFLASGLLLYIKSKENLIARDGGPSYSHSTLIGPSQEDSCPARKFRK